MPIYPGSKLDRSEDQQTRRAREAVLLLRRIVDEVGTDDFSATEVFEAMNPLTRERHDPVRRGRHDSYITERRFGPSHINRLIDMGLIRKIGDDRYEITLPGWRRIL